MSTLKGSETSQTLFVLRDVSLALESGGKWSEAESVWHESLSAWRRRAGNDDPQTLYTLRKLGLAFEAEKKWAEAVAIHREALASSRRLVGNEGTEALVDLERLARALMAQGDFGEAEQLLNEVLTSKFRRNPASAGILVQSVNLLGRRGRWQDAAASAVQLVQFQPTDHYHYHRLAALLAVTDNRPAYQQLCQRLLTSFANPTNPYIAERMAVDCLLLPNSGADLELVDKLADTAVTVGSRSEDLPYFQACKAMASYRLGHFTEALEWGEKATNSSLIFAQAKAYAVLAMAHWQLSQKEAARAMLAKGDALAPRILPGRQADDLGESWVAWLCGRIQLDEASALLQTGSPAGDSEVRP